MSDLVRTVYGEKGRGNFVLDRDAYNRQTAQFQERYPNVHAWLQDRHTVMSRIPPPEKLPPGMTFESYVDANLPKEYHDGFRVYHAMHTAKKPSASQPTPTPSPFHLWRQEIPATAPIVGQNMAPHVVRREFDATAHHARVASALSGVAAAECSAAPAAVVPHTRASAAMARSVNEQKAWTLFAEAVPRDDVSTVRMIASSIKDFRRVMTRESARVIRAYTPDVYSGDHGGILAVLQHQWATTHIPPFQEESPADDAVEEGSIVVAGSRDTGGPQHTALIPHATGTISSPSGAPASATLYTLSHPIDASDLWVDDVMFPASLHVAVPGWSGQVLLTRPAEGESIASTVWVAPLPLKGGALFLHVHHGKLLHVLVTLGQHPEGAPYINTRAVYAHIAPDNDAKNMAHLADFETAFREAAASSSGLAALASRFKKFTNMTINARLLRITRPVALVAWKEYHIDLKEYPQILPANVRAHADVFGDLGEYVADEGNALDNLRSRDVLVEQTGVTVQESLARAAFSLRTKDNVQLNVYMPMLEEQKGWRIVEIPRTGHSTLELKDVYPDFKKGAEGPRGSLAAQKPRALFVTIVLGGTEHAEARELLAGCPRTFAFTFNVKQGAGSAETVRELTEPTSHSVWFAKDLPAHLNNKEHSSNASQTSTALLMVEYLPKEGGKFGRIAILYKHHTPSSGEMAVATD